MLILINKRLLPLQSLSIIDNLPKCLDLLGSKILRKLTLHHCGTRAEELVSPCDRLLGLSSKRHHGVDRQAHVGHSILTWMRCAVSEAFKEFADCAPTVCLRSVIGGCI